MNTNIQPYDPGAIMEQVIARGDISKLSPQERASYYTQLCTSLGLNPLTKPFEYITLNGKLTLYALKGATDQLRKVYGVSLDMPQIDYQDDLIVVTITGRDSTGRTDCDIGAVSIGNLKGEARANAIMKAITKAKRRLTLSLCGLGMLDESEVETIPNARPFVEVEQTPTTHPITPEQWQAINALGKEIYGGGWLTVAKTDIKRATNGRTDNHREMTADEAEKMFESLEDQQIAIAEAAYGSEAAERHAEELAI